MIQPTAVVSMLVSSSSNMYDTVGWQVWCALSGGVGVHTRWRPVHWFYAGICKTPRLVNSGSSCSGIVMCIQMQCVGLDLRLAACPLSLQSAVCEVQNV